MTICAKLYRSSLVKKFIMAATGVLLLGFVLGHLVGNLQIFLGPDALNRYGEFLHANVEILWPVRIGMITLVALHVLTAVRLYFENNAARPTGYAGSPAAPGSDVASRTMVLSGLMVAAFVIYHLLHYTADMRAVNLAGRDFSALLDEKGRHDVYAMVVLGFEQPLVSGFYILALGLLCLHLSHGIYAVFQSLGIKVGFAPDLPKILARCLALVIFLGYISIPAAVLGGLGKNYVSKMTTPPPAIVAGEVVR